MTATYAAGRYEVRGGPGGYLAVRHVTRHPRAIVRDHYTDRWPVLAQVRVPRGASVTHYGMLGAVMRVWHLA